MAWLCLCAGAGTQADASADAPRKRFAQNHYSDSAVRKPIHVTRPEEVRSVITPMAQKTVARKPISGNAAAQRAMTQSPSYAMPPQPYVPSYYAYLPQEQQAYLRPLPPEAYYQSYAQPKPQENNWAGLKDPGRKIELFASPGLRFDDFEWSIAGNITGSAPNILSELTWSDISYLVLEAGVVYQERRENSNFGHYAEIIGFYGDAYDGKNQDSDYIGDNRTLEFSRSNNSSDTGYTEGIKLGLGMTYHLDRENSLWRITGLGGYSYRESQYVMTNGFQTIPASGAFDGLDSTFTTLWRGPYFGAEVSGFLGGPKHYLRARAERHIVDYDGTGNWNLRTDFVHPESFRHRADGTGTVLELEYRFAFRPRWSVGLKGQYETWEIDYGLDQTYLSSGASGYTRLNNTDWESTSYFITLGYKL